MSGTRFPLQWPAGWPRQKSSRRRARFSVTFDRALSDLQIEIERMGGREATLSTNLPIRMDGTLNRAKGEPADCGVAVYFFLKQTQKVFACDTFDKVGDNIRAISLTINAFRSMDRYGASGLMERALTGFDALPAPTKHWDVLGMPKTATVAEIKDRFRALAKDMHTDINGGSEEPMRALLAARDAALKEKGEK